MVLILTTHGKIIKDDNKYIIGCKDIHLCDDGFIFAQNCANIIQNKNIKIDICFSSDLIRTIETSTIIKTKLKQNYPLYTSKKIRDRDYGDLNGKKKDIIKDLYSDKQLDEWLLSYYERPPNGENFNDVIERVSTFFNENIFNLLNKKNILLVTHKYPLNALIVYLKEKNIEIIKHCDNINNDLYFIYF
jgi:2,3-bisphosphoglycerate-dependent phosphoglycerate mutase